MPYYLMGHSMGGFAAGAVHVCLRSMKSRGTESAVIVLVFSVCSTLIALVPTILYYEPLDLRQFLCLMMAGATSVEVGAANLVNPFACRDIVADLPRVMEKYRINTLSEIIGGAK